MDNFRIPRLWREKTPQICGEQAVSGRYSNTAAAPERRQRVGDGARGGLWGGRGRLRGSFQEPFGERSGDLRPGSGPFPGALRTTKRAPDEPR